MSAERLITPFIEGKKLKTLLALLLGTFNLLCADPIASELESAYVTLFSKEFGYTLIGEKPASKKEFNDEYLYSHPHVISKLSESLKRNFQDSKKIFFKVFNENNHHFTAELIHLPAIKKIASDNVYLKDFIKKNFQNEADFYEKLKDPQVKLFDILQQDPYIIGIVLGYGDANSEYFCRRCQIGSYLKKYYFGGPFSFYKGACLPWVQESWPQNIKAPYALKKPEINLLFRSLEKEWCWIQDVWWELDEEREAKPPYFIALPFYVCRHGGDSELTREKYKLARMKLAKLFSNTSIQEAVAKEIAK